MLLISMRSTELKRRECERLLAVVPIGSVEQHSDHLPLGTDAVTASAVASGVEEERPDRVLLCPTAWYGASDHHLGFAGTVSIGTEPLVDTLTGIALSLHRSTGIRQVLVVNGHGGNKAALTLTAERISRVADGPRLWGLSYWDAMNPRLEQLRQPTVTVRHACHVETSIMLAIGHDGVDMSVAESDEARPDIPDWLATSSRFPARTGHGGIGDPTKANATDGNLYLRAAVEGVVTLVDQILGEWSEIAD